MNTMQVHVVDDDADVRKGLLVLLKSAGYPVQGHVGAESFLDSVAGKAAELSGCLILDVRMPVMDGLALQRRLVDDGVLIPIIFLTGHGELPDAVDAMRNGAIDFLLKPVDAKLLLQRLASCWAAEQERCQLQQQRAQRLSCVQRLTAREREVLRFALEGMRSNDIARRLGLRLRTIEAHRSRLLIKLDAPSIQDWQRGSEQFGMTSAQIIEQLSGERELLKYPPQVVTLKS